MALPWELISENVLNVSQVLNDFLNMNVEKDVTWVVKNEDGSVTNVTVPNLAKAINAVKDNAVSEDELASELANYYTKVEVDAIKNSILFTIPAISVFLASIDVQAECGVIKIFGAENRIFPFEGGSSVKTSTIAPRIVLFTRALYKSFSFTIPPRAAFTRIADFFIIASSWACIRFCVSMVNGV